MNLKSLVDDTIKKIRSQSNMKRQANDIFIGNMKGSNRWDERALGNLMDVARPGVTGAPKISENYFGNLGKTFADNLVVKPINMVSTNIKNLSEYNNSKKLMDQNRIENNKLSEAGNNARLRGDWDSYTRINKMIADNTNRYTGRHQLAINNIREDKNKMRGQIVNTGLTTLSLGMGAEQLLKTIAQGSVLGTGFAGINQLLENGKIDPQRLSSEAGVAGGESIKWAGLNRLTNPVFEPIIKRVQILGKSSPVMRKMLQAFAGGVTNLAEDEAYTRATENRSLRPDEAVWSIVLGSGLSALQKLDKQQQQVIESSIKGMPKLNVDGRLIDPDSKQFKEGFLREIKNNYIAEFGSNVKGLGEFLKYSDPVIKELTEKWGDAKYLVSNLGYDPFTGDDLPPMKPLDFKLMEAGKKNWPSQNQRGSVGLADKKYNAETGEPIKTIAQAPVSDIKTPKIKLVPQTQPQINTSTQLKAETPVGIKQKAEIVPQKSLSPEPIIPPKKPTIKIRSKNGDIKERGLVTSVGESTNITDPTKANVSGQYKVKPNKQLMGEAKALLNEGASIDFKNTKDLDKKVAATIQEAINLDQTGKHNEAAALYNNLSEHATELGRGVQAFSLLQKMSPEAISLSAAGKIKKYNATHSTKIPEMTGQQQKLIADKVTAIRQMVEGREKNIAINELGNIINNFIPSSLGDKVTAVWKAGLLTSFRTHERNFVGNAIHGVAEIGKDVFAAPVDMLMKQKTGRRTLTLTTKGTGEFASKSTRQQMADIVAKGYDPSEQISKFDTRQVNWGESKLGKIFKTYTDAVFRTLGAEDKPFYNAAMARSLYDQAGAEAINIGKRGNKSFIENLVKNPTEDMLKIAISDANVATFKSKNVASNVASNLKRVLGKNAWTKLVGEITMPFTGVPSSIVGQTIAYSPIGLVRGSINVGRVVSGQVPELQRQAAQELGRGVIGTAIFSLGAYLMSKGIMTGQPKDATEADQWKLEGKQANSILIDGKWRSINSIGPESLIMLAGAKYNEEMNSPDGSIGSYAGGLAKDQLSQTFLAGVQQPLNAITDPSRYGKSYIGNQSASIIPNIVKDTAKAFDPVQRETNTVGDYMKSGIPFARNELLPKRDVLGNELKQEPTGAGAFVDLFNSKTPISNPLVDELARLNNTGANATPSKLQKSQTIGGVKRTLTPEELDSLEQQSGPVVTQALNNLISSPAYLKMDDEDRARAIDSLVTKIRKQVRATADINPMPDMGYTKSKDAPSGILETASTYGKSVITDPSQTIKAVLDGNPIRKVEGGAVILERKNALGSLDSGDKSTQVDHIIALTLGGTNDKSNLQTLTNEENQIKGQVEVYLYNQLKAGKITKKEAQERDLNWRDEIANLPKNVQTKLVADLSTGETYQLVSTSGSVKDVDLTIPTSPTLSGLSELDKKIMSKYNSEVTAKTNDIYELYKQGQITEEKANELLTKIKVSKEKVTKATGTKKAKKITIKKPVTPKIKLKGYKKMKPKKIKRFKLKKLNSIKIIDKKTKR